MSPYSRFLFYPEFPRLLPSAYPSKSPRNDITSNGWIRMDLAGRQISVRAGLAPSRTA